MRLNFARLALLGLAAALVFVGGAQSAPAKYYPPLLIEPLFAAVPGSDGSVTYIIHYNYGGGLSVNYPQIGKNDAIPAIRAVVSLPEGSHIVWSKIDFGGLPNNGKLFLKVSVTNLRWHTVGGHPTWTYVGVGMMPIPRWQFRLAGTTTSACVKVNVQGLYFKRVKEGEHLVKKLVPIPHAPMQYGQTPGC